MKICSVIKQRLDGQGNLIEGEKAYLVAYFPRTKDEMIAAITANNTIGISNVTEVQEGKVWTAKMTKLNEELWKLTFIYHELMEREVFNENLKQYKGAIMKEAQLILGKDTLIEYDEINWIDKPFF